MADDRPVVVSLTSIPPRFPHLGRVLASLLAQKLAPARIVLVIPRAYRRFPGWDGRLPAVPPGVEILRTDADLGPASKVLPMARALRGQAVDLAYCDDDVRLAGHWLRALRRVARDRPGCAIAAAGYDLVRSAVPQDPGGLPQVRRLTAASPPDPARQPGAWIETAGLAQVAMGHGGVLVRPEWFPDAAFDIPEDAWPVDDIWLSGWLALQGLRIWVDPIVPMPQTLPAVHGTAPLLTARVGGRKRAASNRAAVDAWRARGIWPLP